ncbi:condensation domain-containing protein [Actinoplanes sp. NPDC051346]|uniref:condensation domain-containing protein n=1 Tax=Actinoplanes sp. NPDC051346 TaxID=3155048 RepID=UPI003417F60A
MGTPPSTRDVALPFHGSRGGTGPLTWGQQHMYQILNDLYPESSGMNVVVDVPLREGLRQSDVADALRTLVERHEALRTIYRSTSDGVRQEVIRSGTIVLSVLDAPAVTDELRRDVRERLATGPFELDREPALRSCLLTSGGEPRHLTVVFCHLACDAIAVDVVRSELAAVSAASHGRPPPERVHQPLEQAAFEESPAGVRTAERSLRYAQSILRAMPQTMLPREPVSYEEPRFRYLHVRSEALALAANALAARHRLSSRAAVIYAGLTTVAGYANGLTRSFLQLIAAGRLREETHHAVGSYSQEAFALVDLADADMDEVIRRSARTILCADRFGTFPVPERAELVRAVERERGVRVSHPGGSLNYVNRARGGVTTDRPTAAALAAAALRTTWQWIDGDNSAGCAYLLHALDNGFAFDLRFLVDTTVIPVEEAAAWLRSVERLLCRAAVTELPLAELSPWVDVVPPSRGSRWRLVDSSWIDLHAVADVVRSAGAVQRVDVFVDGTELVAYLAADAPVDLVRLRDSCQAALAGRRTAMVPHRFVVCADAPAVSDPSAWRTRRTVASGSGHSGVPTGSAVSRAGR